MAKDNTEYLGNELELFANAHNWKSYFAATIQPYLGKEVLEVGAGIGETTKYCFTEQQTSWALLEPDQSFQATLHKQIETQQLPSICRLLGGYSTELPEDARFDSIIYIDVLEHIEDDAGELNTTAPHLNSGGHFILLSPAYPWLFSAFDKQVGHYRRYTKKTMRDIIPEGFTEVHLGYRDSLAVILSLLNRMMLRQSLPKQSQIDFWDKKVVPVSRKIDPVLGYSFGRSLVGVYRKN